MILKNSLRKGRNARLYLEGLFPRGRWGAELTGFIRIEEDGVYRFTGHGENWLRFYIDEQMLR